MSSQIRTPGTFFGQTEVFQISTLSAMSNENP